MSVNVIERILLQALKHAKLIDPATQDKWANGAAFKKLQRSRERSFLKQPPIYSESISGAVLPVNKKYILQHSQRRCLIVDSGAAFHVVDLNNLSHAERATIRELDEPILLQSAGGVVRATHVADIYIDELGVTIEGYLLPGTPDALSLGELVRTNGFDFVWRNLDVDNPYLLKGNQRYYLFPNNNCPTVAVNQPVEVEVSSVGAASSNETPAHLAPGNATTATPPVPQEVPEQPPNPSRGNPKESRRERWRARQSGVIAHQLAGVREKAREYEAEKMKRRVIKAFKKKVVMSPHNKHNLSTHFPRDPNCEICQVCNVHRAYLHSQVGPQADQLPEPKAAGEMITLDHKILNEDDQSRSNDRVTCVIQDKFSHLIHSYPGESKSAEETKYASQSFLGPEMKVKHVYSDNSPEVISACEQLGLSHDASTPHRPATNGIAEKAVHRVKIGTACALHQSGLNDPWWAEASSCYCFLRSTTDILQSGETAYKKTLWY